MEDKKNQEDVKNLGKIKSIKENKSDKTYINYFSTDDVYCDVKKISISKKDLVREGDNGLKIPEKFFNFEKCEISYDLLVELFIFSPEITFNTSNQFSKIPVTFTAKLNKEINIFINLHQIVLSSKNGFAKLCDDKSNIKIGNKIYEINKKSIESFTSYLNKYFENYVLGNKFSDFDFSLIKNKNNNIFSNIKNIFYKNKDTFVDDFYLKNFLLKNKKINIMKVYP